MLCFLTNIEPHLLGTEWQPSLFDCTVKVPCFTVPSNHLSFVIKQCKPIFLKMPKLNPVKEAEGLFCG